MINISIFFTLTYFMYLYAMLTDRFTGAYLSYLYANYIDFFKCPLVTKFMLSWFLFS